MSTSISTPQPDLGMIKQRQQKMWSSGDYSEVGARLVVMSEKLCDAVDLRAGSKVLDVASGNGNAALGAARRFCDVISTDYVPELLQRGRQRAEAERLPMTFEVADAENLPYADGSFDFVLSAIGAMFAPDQQRTAQELVRVCKPGGRIGMVNWVPDSFVGDMFRIVAKYNPPPPGVKSPLVWGTRDGLEQLFGNAVTFKSIERRAIAFYYRSPEHFPEFMATNFGPIKTALAAIEPEQQSALLDDLKDMALGHNRSGDDTLVLDSDYLEVVAVKA